MSRQSYFFIVIFILSIFSLTYSQTMIFVDDFESYAMGSLPTSNWTTRFSGQSAQITDAISISGSKSFELVSRPSWARVETHQLSEIPNYLVYEGYVYLNQPDKGACIGYGKQISGNEYFTYNTITFRNEGKISFSGAATEIELQSWSSQTWYKVKVYCDFINLKGKVWIDNILKAENVNLVPRESFEDLCIAGRNWSGSGTSTVYYDDIKLYAYVLPLLEDDFESYATGSLPTPNWTTRFNGQSARVSEAVSVSGSKSFELVSTPYLARVETHQLSEIPDYLVYEGYVYLNQSDKGACIGLGKQISGNEYFTYNTITFHNEGKISFSGAATEIELQSWSSQTWYKIKVYCDFINLNGKVWIDNMLKAENINLVSRESFEDLCIAGRNWSGSGTSTVYYDDIKIYVYVPLLESPVLSEPSNGATGVETDPTLKWNASDSAVTYTLEISKDSSFTTTVFAESGITTTMKKISGLENNTRYFWRVNASASWGDSDWSNVWNFMTAPIPPPEPPVLSEPINGATGVETDPTLKWNASVGATSYEIKLALDSTFTQIIFENSGISQTSQKINRLANNMLYYWHVNASNSYGTGNWSKTANFKTISTIAINNVVYFPGYNSPVDYSPTDYIIVGLPGASNLPVYSFLTGNAGEHWQVYWDNGSNSNDPEVYLDLFDNSSKFNFSIGRAFWLINKGAWSISSTVNAAEINHKNYVSIPLHDGWNLITNPYLFSITWAVIQAANSISTPIYQYRGIYGFSESAIFEPYIGYYYDNATNIDSLRIPFQWELLKPLSAEKRTNCISWSVNVSLSVNDSGDDSIYFGVSQNSSLGYDILDFRKPRTIAAVPGLYFYHPEWDPNYSTFATDIRPEFDEMESWDFEVRGVHQQNSRLDFTGIEQIPAPMEIYLVDEGRAKSVNLREQRSYDFMGIGDIMKFQVVVGKSETVEEKLSEMNMPRKFALGNNYPNPFNPETTIPVEIPIAADVTLKIFNVLGQQVKTIYQGNVEAGRYQFTWDGRDQAGNILASGVYILHLSTNSRISLTSKMILMQ